MAQQTTTASAFRGTEGLRSRFVDSTACWLLLLAATVALFFWEILFTDQFSLLLGWEQANQAYAWYTFAATSIQHGLIPLWDPYTFSGHSFIGEMQTGLFDPLKLVLYLWPLGTSGRFSGRLFHEFFVLMHFLGACFLFVLARDIGIKSKFSAFVSALCFTLAGFVGRVGWLNMLDAAIWTPLIFLCLLRALRSSSFSRTTLYAALGGISLGMAILAGSLHVAMMDVILIVSAALFFAFHSFGEHSREGTKWIDFRKAAFVIALIAVISFAAGAIQLLPSIEYGRLALRWSGDWAGPFTTRIPYHVVGSSGALPPRGIFAFLFGATNLPGAEFGPYFGVMPLLLTVIGIWWNWRKPWVRYLTVLGAAAFFYSLGWFSFLHGALYILIPYLDKAREAARFIYLTNFAMALLAGFGVQSLLSGDSSPDFLQALHRVLQWVVIVVSVALGIPALLNKPEVGPWPYFFLLLLIGSWLVVFFIRRRSRAWPVLLVVLIVSDLYAFNWIPNRMVQDKAGTDYLEQLLSMQGLAHFLHSQPGLFRVHLEGPLLPNIGDTFRVQETRGNGVSLLKDYLPFLESSQGVRLLNVRYIVSRAKTPGRVVYSQAGWNVLENPRYCPRAWIVYRTLFDSSEKDTEHRVLSPDFDPMQSAYVSKPLQVDSQPSAPDSIRFNSYQADRIDVTVNSPSRALLVLSEIYYPGWGATVNGKPAHIYKVDGLLRGLKVPGGQARVVLRYRPRSILTGAVLTAFAFAGTLVFAGILALKRKRRRE